MKTWFPARFCDAALMSMTRSLLLVLGTKIALAATIHVPADYERIQDAIEKATEGDTVLVAPGTYTENLSFLGKAIVVSGSAPEDLATVAATVVKAAKRDAVVSFRQGEGRSSILCGLSLTGGAGAIWGHGDDSRAGGGIFCDDYSAPLIHHCWIHGNEAHSGGGIAWSHRAAPRILDSRIESNTAIQEGWRNDDGEWGNYSGRGGGLFEPQYGDEGQATIRRCLIRANSAMDSGGAAQIGDEALFTDCEIVANTADYIGGGVCIADAGNPRFRGCLLQDNRAELGGAVFVSGSYSDEVFEACRIVANQAAEEGGGFFVSNYAKPILNHCLLARNQAPIGAAIHSDYYYEGCPSLNHCTIVDHGPETAAVLAGRSSPVWEYYRIRNSIIWNPEAPLELEASARISHTLIRGGWEGDHILDQDPLFRDDGSYHLQSVNCGDAANSPAIDRGDPARRDLRLSCEAGLRTALPDLGVYGGGSDCALKIAVPTPSDTVQVGDVVVLDLVVVNSCAQVESFERATARIRGPRAKDLILYDGLPELLAPGDSLFLSCPIEIDSSAPPGTYMTTIFGRSADAVIAGDRWPVVVREARAATAPLLP